MDTLEVGFYLPLPPGSQFLGVLRRGDEPIPSQEVSGGSLRSPTCVVGGSSGTALCLSQKVISGGPSTQAIASSGSLLGSTSEPSEEVVFGHPMSLFSIPTAPLLGVVAPHMGSSAEEGPTPPSSSVRVCLYVSSSDPPSAPPMVTPSREEAVGWSFAPRGEDTLEDPSMVIPPSSNNVSTD
ncbi:hypothetical protein B296_00031596 [Ensete ventricosum]|uniref:Uncharacterized protein n=1 Tax=Ensete ventricosum TaxID=4639 RepID=A0A427A7A9_ENSVE|nr:hypothetical protein B296_00031596 [Ensete ventricosum]